MKLRTFLTAAAFAMAPLTMAHAQSFSVTITVDENGNGLFTNTAGFSGTLPFDLQADPGPGGLSSVLTYSLLDPPGLTEGDVDLFDLNGTLSDVIRFNPNETCTDLSTGCLLFYSNPIDGFDSLADTPAPPAPYTNLIDLAETTPFTAYTPTAGEPGFVTGAGGPVTYNFISDVPEPLTLSLLGGGLAAIAVRRRKTKKV